MRRANSSCALYESAVKTGHPNPAYNEAENIAGTLADIPRHYEGIDEVQVVVIDDGSTDGTARVALANGADAVIRHRRNRGLSRAFIRYSVRPRAGRGYHC